MRSVIAHVFLLTIAIHLFYSSGFLLDYYINSASYIANCENIDRPELNCDGKCILALKMKDVTQSDEPNFSPIPQNFEFDKRIFQVVFKANSSPRVKPGYQSEIHAQLLSSDCFHPPRLG